MANTHENLTSLFTDIADAIRSKTGETNEIVADTFPEAIAAIESGGDLFELLKEGEFNFYIETYSNPTGYRIGKATRRENAEFSIVICSITDAVSYSGMYFIDWINKTCTPITCNGRESPYYSSLNTALISNDVCEFKMVSTAWSDPQIGTAIQLYPISELISFTISGTTYYAEPDMTWGQWVVSAYNTDDFIDDGNYISLNGAYIVDADFVMVASTDVITANADYNFLM